MIMLHKNIFFKYQKPSEFPISKRDLSFQVSNKETIDEISNKILEFKSEVLKDAFLFDYFEDFKNKNFKAGYRFIFQHIFKTLTDEEINFEMENLIKEILEIQDVSIPGYKKMISKKYNKFFLYLILIFCRHKFFFR